MSHLGVPFEYKKYIDLEVWAEEKLKIIQAGFPRANLPMITDPNNADYHLAETNAILQYLAMRYSPQSGCLPHEIPEFWSTLGLVDDLLANATEVCYLARDCDQLKELWLRDKAKIQSRLDFVVQVLGSGAFAFGGRMTYIDMLLAEFTERCLLMEQELRLEYLQSFEKKVLGGHFEGVLGCPRIDEWRKSKRFRARPFNAPHAAAWF